MELPLNITLSIDEQIASKARESARKMGKSLNEAVRDYLEQLAGIQFAEQEFQAFELRCINTKGRLSGWKFNREEANARR